jgi:hypothetical protein
VGFGVGLCLFALAWSSVVKTLLVPGNTRSLITRVAARGVLTGFRLGASRMAGMELRERVLAAGPPVFLVGLLGCWIGCLYVAYALILLPFSASPAAALRMSGSSLFTLGFAVPDGVVPRDRIRRRDQRHRGHRDNPRQAWPVALLAVLDAAALHLALCRNPRPPRPGPCSSRM